MLLFPILFTNSDLLYFTDGFLVNMRGAGIFSIKEDCDASFFGRIHFKDYAIMIRVQYITNRCLSNKKILIYYDMKYEFLAIRRSNAVHILAYFKFLNYYISYSKILNLFQRMKKEKIQANEMIYALLIDACSTIGDLSLSKSIISQIPKSLLNNLWIQNSSIDMWVSLFFNKNNQKDLFQVFFLFRVNVVHQNKPNVFLIVLINQMRFLMQP